MNYLETPYFSLELPDGIVVLKQEIANSQISYSIQHQFVYWCLKKKARLYKLVNPLPEYKGHAYAWCDDENECILLKEFPLTEQHPSIHSFTLRIPYDSIHHTINPVEADLFWRENHESNERESRILLGLAAIQDFGPCLPSSARPHRQKSAIPQSRGAGRSIPRSSPRRNPVQ
jgi:hypothetical protein